MLDGAVKSQDRRPEGNVWHKLLQMHLLNAEDMS